ncbi:hypothetical protein [Leptolyngbya sp. KIOST-1]|uniref:hypothetical protein n=1 Tax=Leptolyngbya sp. KIOST-1 TaxID=1229172 RepID=UPI000A4B4FDE|nr:hypothetical protein [Leptolyngbya sp. KIOST-1]
MAIKPLPLGHVSFCELRTLQSLDGLGASPSNTVILFPLELSRALGNLRASQPVED